MIIPLLVMLIVTFGWRVTFLITAGLSLVWLVLWMFFGKQNANLQAEEVTFSQDKRPGKIEWKNLLPALKNPSFIFPALALFAAGWSTTFGLVFISNYLTEVRGLTPQTMGMVIAIGGLGSALLGITFAALSDRLFKKSGKHKKSRVLFCGIGMMVAGLSFFSITIVQSPILMIIGYAIKGAFASMLVAVAPQIVITAKPDQPGSVLGFWFIFSGLAGIVCPIVSGKIIQASGALVGAGFTNAFLVSCLLSVIAGLLMAIFTNPDATVSKPVQSVNVENIKV
ncbi:MFS transporter [Bacillus sp. JJ722]|uniref:MFS transporter n=1 Tax=Bacillus sp. JJ722 TaxID=3122973 RepID=UPI002FFDF564